MGRIDVRAERVIARLAVHDELLSRSDLLAAGVRAAAIDDRVRSGRLRLVHPGVYFAGHGRLSRLQVHRAAVLACAPAWSGLDTAAEIWRILAAHPGSSHVLRTGQRRDGPHGVVVHRTRDLPPTELTVHRGIPITTPARTLLDLAAAKHPGLELAFDEAHALGLVERADLARLAASGRRGSPGLRTLLTETPGYTRQAAERLLRRLVLKAQLPSPVFNAEVLGKRRDAVWAELRLVLEVDGYASHQTRHAFDEDRRRDQQLAAHGWLTLRVTWHQLVHEPEALLARVAQALALRAAG